jgi:hypothetical protein
VNDTPRNIKNPQLKIWLSKPPAERLRQFLIDNEALQKFWETARKNLKQPLITIDVTDYNS